MCEQRLDRLDTIVQSKRKRIRHSEMIVKATQWNRSRPDTIINSCSLAITPTYLSPLIQECLCVNNSKKIKCNKINARKSSKTKLAGCYQQQATCINHAYFRQWRHHNTNFNDNLNLKFPLLVGATIEIDLLESDRLTNLFITDIFQCIGHNRDAHVY